jgi:hypothetical protein
MNSAAEVEAAKRMASPAESEPESDVANSELPFSDTISAVACKVAEATGVQAIVHYPCKIVPFAFLDTFVQCVWCIGLSICC